MSSSHFYKHMHKADDGPAIRKLFADMCQAMDYQSMPDWPDDYERAVSRFRNITRPYISRGIWMTVETPTPRNQEVISVAMNDIETTEIVLMIGQYRSGLWQVYLTLEEAHLPQLPWGMQLIRDFVDRMAILPLKVTNTAHFTDAKRP